MKYTLPQLLKLSVAAFDALTPEQQKEKLRQQRINWVHGNVSIANPEITREMVEEAAKNWV